MVSKWTLTHEICHDNVALFSASVTSVQCWSACRCSVRPRPDQLQVGRISPFGPLNLPRCSIQLCDTTARRYGRGIRLSYHVQRDSACPAARTQCFPCIRKAKLSRSKVTRSRSKYWHWNELNTMNYIGEDTHSAIFSSNEIPWDQSASVWNKHWSFSSLFCGTKSFPSCSTYDYDQTSKGTFCKQFCLAVCIG